MKWSDSIYEYGKRVIDADPSWFIPEDYRLCSLQTASTRHLNMPYERRRRSIISLIQKYSPVCVSTGIALLFLEVYILQCIFKLKIDVLIIHSTSAKIIHGSDERFRPRKLSNRFRGKLPPFPPTTPVTEISINCLP